MLNLLEQHKYATTQIDVPDPIAKKIVAFNETIPKRFLCGNKIETNSHITLKYGVSDLANEELKSIEQKPFEVSFGKLDFFPPSEGSDGCDVLYISVILNKDLQDLRSKIMRKVTVENNDTRKYIPHCTLAYMKPGTAKLFKGKDTFSGLKFMVDSFTIGNRDDSKVKINLLENIIDNFLFEATIRLRKAIPITNRKYVNLLQQYLSNNDPNIEQLGAFPTPNQHHVSGDNVPEDRITILDMTPGKIPSPLGHFEGSGEQVYSIVTSMLQDPDNFNIDQLLKLDHPVR